MFHLTSKTVDNFDEITFSQVLKIHSEKPYMHSIVVDGKIEYIKKFDIENYNVFIWTNAWEPEDVFFNLCCFQGNC